MNQPLPLKKLFFAALKFALLVSFTTFLLPGKLFAQAPTLSYATPPIYTVGAAITTLTPTHSNVAAAAYSSTAVVLANTAPASIGTDYGQLGAVATGLLNGEEPAIFVAGAGSFGPVILYVIDNGTVYEPLVQMSNGSGPVNAMVTDGKGYLYYTTGPSTNSVWKLGMNTASTPVAIATGGSPYALAADTAGNVYYADYITGVITKIPAQHGASPVVIGTVPGTQYMAADAAGNVYVGNGFSSIITKIPAGGGSAVQLNFGIDAVHALAADASGNLFVNNNGESIDEIPAGSSTPVVLYIPGSNDPLGLAVGPAGNIYFADFFNSLVEEIPPLGGYYLSAPLPAGLSFNNKTGAISGTPTAPSPTTTYTITAYNASGTSVSTTVNITVAVSINSLTIANNSITNASIVNYTAVFNAPISGLTASNFSLAPAGLISGATVGTPTSTNGSTTWTVPINTGSGNGTIRMDMVNATGLSAKVSTTLPFRGQSFYTIDKTAPSPNSVSFISNNANTGVAKTGDVITLAIPYSKQIQTPVVTIGGHSVTPVNTVGNTWSAPYTVTSSDPDGNISFDITATDLAGNVTESTSADFGSYVLIDNTAPTATINPSWGPGAHSVGNDGTASASYFVEYNDANFNTSNLTIAGITLNHTGTATGTVALSGSGTSYTVTISNITGVGTLGISVSGGHSTDIAGNKDAGAGPSATLTVESIPPTAISITGTTPSPSPPTNATSIIYTVTFSEAVTGVDATDFTVTTSGTTGSVTNVSGSGTTYTVTVSGISGNGFLRLDVNNTGHAITDVAGTALTAGFTGGDTYVINQTLPGVTGSSFLSNNSTNTNFAKAGDVITLLIGYNKQVQTPVVTIGGHSVTPVNSSGNNWSATYTVTPSDPDGHISFDITATDLAGNVIESTPADFGSYITIDNTVPTATISAPSAASAGNDGTASVTYGVAYNDVNFNSSNLTNAGITLNHTGTATGTVTLSGSGTHYTVTISNITGTGTLGISIAAGTGTDLAGNSAPASGASTTFAVTPGARVDQIVAATLSGNAASVNFTVVFSQAITGVTAANFQVAATGVSGATAGTPTTADGGITWVVPVNTGTGDGTLFLNLQNSNNLTPTVINAPFTLISDPDNILYTVDKTPPTITISAPSAASTTTGPITYTVTYADANFNSSNLRVANITLNSTGGATGTVAVTGTGLTRTVTISSITGTGTLGISIASATASDLAGNLAPAAGPSATFTTGVVLSTDATLSSIVPGDGYQSGLSPAFSTGVHSYTLNVINTTGAISFTPTVHDPNATVKVNGIVTTSGTESWSIPLKSGSNTMNIKGVAQDGVTVSSYIITVIRSTQSSDASLSNLALSSGTLTPAFAPSVYNYTANVPNTTSSIMVTPTEGDPTLNASSITVNGTPVASGSPATIPLNVGDNTITTVVIAQNGITTLTYTTVVTRAAVVLSTDATLSSIVPGDGYQSGLSPAFSTGVHSYTLNVINTTGAISFTPTVHDPNATVKVNGIVTTSGTESWSIPLKFGSNTMNIKGVAQDGVTVSSYMITVIRSTQSSDASLSNLALSSGTITPAFAPSVYHYTANVPNATSSIMVTPTEGDPTLNASSITVNGNLVASGSPATIPLNVGDNTITTIVIAQNGITTLTYTTVVTRAATGGGNAARFQETSVNPTDNQSLANTDLLVHPAVSPNGDGINDFLYIENIQNHPENKVTLLNRSGAVIFEMSGYDNYAKVFNGHSSINGAMIQPGTYYYLVEYSLNGENKRKTGFFVLK